MSSVFEDMNESEKQVADFLSNIGLWWRYEHPVFVYGEKERHRVWTPNSYLPKMGIYIEVCGSGDLNHDYGRQSSNMF